MPLGAGGSLQGHVLARPEAEKEGVTSWASAWGYGGPLAVFMPDRIELRSRKSGMTQKENTTRELCALIFESER